MTVFLTVGLAVFLAYHLVLLVYACRTRPARRLDRRLRQAAGGDYPSG